MIHAKTHLKGGFLEKQDQGSLDHRITGSPDHRITGLPDQGSVQNESNN